MMTSTRFLKLSFTISILSARISQRDVVGSVNFLRFAFHNYSLSAVIWYCRAKQGGAAAMSRGCQINRKGKTNAGLALLPAVTG